MISKTTLGTLIALALATTALGCGDDDKKLPSSGSGATGGGGSGGSSGSGGGAGAAGAAGTGGVAGTGGGGGSGGGTGGGGGLPVIDEPDTACTDATATGKTVYAPNAVLGLYALERAGARWAASGLSSNGFVLFDQDGANATATPIEFGNIDRIAGSPTDLAVATIDNTGVKAGRFDAQGSAIGSAVELATGFASDLALGRSGDDVLAVWTTVGGTQARVASATAAAGAPFDLEAGVAVDQFSASIAPNGAGAFAVAWADRKAADSSYRSFFAFVTAAGVQGLVHLLHSGSAKIQVISLVATSTGFALLEEVDGVPHLLVIDKSGTLVGSAHRLLGANDGWGLAAQGSTLVAFARRDDHRDAIRALDATGKATGPWVCFAPASATGEHAGAIQIDGTGYAVLYRAPDESEVVVHVDDPTKGG